MIEINKNSNSKLNDINLDNFYVIADFDKTITSKQSNTTFSLFSKSGFYPEEYLKERNANYNHYRPLELDVNITEEEKSKIVKEWQEASYNLMLKYKVKESDILKILENDDALTLRDGAINFINYLNENNIPLIISSAGIGNFIIELLKKHECYTNNIYVYSNMLKFKDDEIVDSIDDIIHSMNKNAIKVSDEFLEKTKDKKYAVVIGDQLSDINMAKYLPKKDIISFGFLEANVEESKKMFYDSFDVVLTENESFDAIKKLLIERRK